MALQCNFYEYDLDALIREIGMRMHDQTPAVKQERPTFEEIAIEKARELESLIATTTKLSLDGLAGKAVVISLETANEILKHSEFIVGTKTVLVESFYPSKGLEQISRLMTDLKNMFVGYAALRGLAYWDVNHNNDQEATANIVSCFQIITGTTPQ